MKPEFKSKLQNKPLSVYLASGWFTEAQTGALVDMEDACYEAGISSYSPRMHGIVNDSGVDPEAVVATNIAKIQDSDFVLASTEGKDIGTVWECGFAFGEGVPVVYYYPHEGKFNIMLSHTALAVCESLPSLLTYLQDIKQNGLAKAIPPKYTGAII